MTLCYQFSLIQVERATELRMAQEVKPLVQEKRDKEEKVMHPLSARYNKDRERDYARVAKNPPHPEVIIATTDAGKEREDGNTKNNTGEYADIDKLDKMDRSKKYRKERMHHGGSRKYYFVREHRKYANSNSASSGSGDLRGLRKEEADRDNMNDEDALAEGSKVRSSHGVEIEAAVVEDEMVISVLSHMLSIAHRD